MACEGFSAAPGLRASAGLGAERAPSAASAESAACAGPASAALAPSDGAAGSLSVALNSDALTNPAPCSAASGRPYTAKLQPTRFGGNGTVGAINGNRLPWRFNLDTRVDKSFNLAAAGKKPLNINVYLRVSNLLNRKNVNLFAQKIVDAAKSRRRIFDIENALCIFDSELEI